MHAFLIVGGTQTEREEKARSFTKNIHPIDTIILFPDPSIGIEKVRKLGSDLFLKPSKSSQKAALIFQAEKMTTAAQNAFLKTLEEPPGNSFLVLTAPNTKLLTPTLVSRCQVITLPLKGEIRPTGENLAGSLEAVEKILKGETEERLNFTEKISQDRQEVIIWLKMQVILWRYMLLIRQNCKKLLLEREEDSLLRLENIAQRLTTKQIIITINKIRDAEKMLKANVNIRLTIDNLLLDYPSLKRHG